MANDSVEPDEDSMGIDRILDVKVDALGVWVHAIFPCEKSLSLKLGPSFS